MSALGTEGLRVPFGIREGRLCAPGDVENGLKCGCRCPACGSQLVANHPKVKRAYFSHYQSEDCGKGFETALHLMAKQIIEDEGQITLPQLTVEIIAETFSEFQVPELVHFAPRQSALTEVVQEKSVGRWRPDLTAMLKNGATIYIEILVKHAVEEEKAEALDNMMEIDLSDVPPKHVDDLGLLREIVLNKAPRKWFRCSLYSKLPIIEAKKKHLEENIVKGILGQNVKSYSVCNVVPEH